MTGTTAYFGNEVGVAGTSEGMPGVVRQFANFAAAADEAYLSRIWAGIHFRFAMRDTRPAAAAVASFVLRNAAQPVKGNHGGQVP